MKSDSIRRALLDLIRLRAGDTEGQWLENCLVDARQDLDGVLSDVSKRFGKRHLIAGFSQRSSAVLMTQLGPMPIGHWRTDRAARSWLLATLSVDSNAPFKDLFSYYESGDTETRIAALLAINLVDDPDSAQGMMLIHDAGRTYLDELMDAAWCNHPFSAHHMSDVEYRKAVLKALFCDVEISGFLRLDERADVELALAFETLPMSAKQQVDRYLMSFGDPRHASPAGRRSPTGGSFRTPVECSAFGCGYCTEKCEGCEGVIVLRRAPLSGGFSRGSNNDTFCDSGVNHRVTEHSIHQRLAGSVLYLRAGSRIQGILQQPYGYSDLGGYLSQHQCWIRLAGCFYATVGKHKTVTTSDIVQPVGTRPRNGAWHVGDTVMHDTVNHNVGFRGRLAGFDAAALVYSNIHKNRTIVHSGKMSPIDELWCLRPRNEDRSDNQISIHN